MRITVPIGAFLYFKCPYQANIIKTFEIIRRMIVIIHFVKFKKSADACGIIYRVRLAEWPVRKIKTSEFTRLHFSRSTPQWIWRNTFEEFLLQKSLIKNIHKNLTSCQIFLNPCLQLFYQPAFSYPLVESFSDLCSFHSPPFIRNIHDRDTLRSLSCAWISFKCFQNIRINCSAEKLMFVVGHAGKTYFVYTKNVPVACCGIKKSNSPKELPPFKFVMNG